MSYPSLEKLRQQISNIVGDKYVSTDDFARYAYTRTPSWIRGIPPAVVVRPNSTEEVSEIVKLANQLKIPVIPRGGGASVAGFPVSRDADKSILIDLTRMNRILDIDIEHYTVTAECGILLGNLHKTLKKKGLHIFTVDIPFYIDTLGGVISGFNGGGEPADLATSGELYHYILGLKVVLPTGEVIQTGSGPGTNIYQKKTVDRTPNSPDITGMFIGDGGIFGIKTEATVAVEPFPTKFLVGGYFIDTFEKGWDCFRTLVRTVPYLYTRLLLIKPWDYKRWGVIFVIRGHMDEEVQFKWMKINSLCRRYSQEEIMPEEAIAIADRFGNREIGRSYGSRGMYLYFESIFKRSDTFSYMKKLKDFMEKEFLKAKIRDKVEDWVEYVVPKLRTTVVLGAVVFFDKNKLSKEEIEKIIQIQDKYSMFVFENGGFTEANQGTESINASKVWSKEYYNMIKKIKKTLDPNNIINPGLWRL